MNGTRPFILMFAMLGLGSALAQGTFRYTATFDGPPTQPPDTAYTVTRYDEAGIAFRPIAPSHGFGSIGRNPRPGSGRPDNGTAYLQAALGDSLMFSFLGDTVFNLVSVDLAEYSTVFQVPLTVRFVGYRFDGSRVTADLVTDGIIDGIGPLPDFQTFYLGPQFTGLRRVELPGYAWSLDNLVVSIPEPTSAALLLVGGLLLARKTRH